jgi:phosphosulfolactate phosphohydrolase-like enzyme
VGEFVPEGFEMPASPAALAAAPEGRPAVVLAPPGTQVLVNAAAAPRVYVTCLRNLSATAQALDASCSRVAIIGAGQGRDLRSEDQLATAHLARALVEQGFTTEDPFTEDLLSRWGSISTSFVALGRSAEQLRRAGRMEDLEFVMAHTDDLGFACEFIDGEVRAEGVCGERASASSAFAEKASPVRVVPFTIGPRRVEPGLST